ncbi:DUF4349 domain-containing protein [Pedobacter sp. KR3-3]|uniref:DUF4349 domain-containing protein n=1 Tax=Pedobacter albus TaxID=3113905 RepID=A0ABU7I9N4_9SPHI|nr:DUF4349 domain-containing protein [Pedobacter sp. KR3-3]MEE1945986.1 DUF4349 domain-containing protein [Pedobacter sp. KR3-3]
MKKYLVFIAIIGLMFGCNSERKNSLSTESVATLDSAAVASDTTATAKIIKTADMRFRVKDVQQTKEQLGAAIKAEGGTIAEFSIQSQIQESDKVKYSSDSLKEITSYRKEGLLVAKVPSEKLDDFTNTVAKMAVFVDQQSMKMDDQSIAYLANRLKAQNRQKVIKQLDKSKKSRDAETSFYISDDYIDKRIENMDIDNRVKFSTITLSFYQDNTVSTWIVGNDNLYSYRPGFFQRLGLNIADGWTFFKEFLLGLSKLWALIVFGLLIFFGIRAYLRRTKKA